MSILKKRVEKQTINLHLPKTYEELKALESVLRLGMFAQTLRTDELEARYRQAINEGACEKHIEFVKKKMEKTGFYCHLNDFPYDLLLSEINQESNNYRIDHLIFWTQNPNFTPDKKIKLGKYDKFICFENLAKHKSIPQIKHWQVFALSNK